MFSVSIYNRDGQNYWAARCLLQCTIGMNPGTFSNDNAPSDSHSTASTAHLVTQLDAAGVAWMSYQEDINADTCPISSVRFYAPKHDPFVFFKDVAGDPPSSSNAHCIAHHKPYSAFAGG